MFRRPTFLLPWLLMIISVLPWEAVSSPADPDIDLDRAIKLPHLGWRAGFQDLPLLPSLDRHIVVSRNPKSVYRVAGGYSITGSVHSISQSTTPQQTSRSTVRLKTGISPRNEGFKHAFSPRNNQWQIPWKSMHSLHVQTAKYRVTEHSTLPDISTNRMSPVARRMRSIAYLRDRSTCDPLRLRWGGDPTRKSDDVWMPNQIKKLISKRNEVEKWKLVSSPNSSQGASRHP